MNKFRKWVNFNWDIEAMFLLAAYVFIPMATEVTNILFTYVTILIAVFILALFIAVPVIDPYAEETPNA